MNLITYVLYGQKKNYWKFFPAIYLSLRLLHPSFVGRFYFADDTADNPGRELIERLSREDHAVEAVTIPGEYEKEEPRAWRMKPFWDVVPEVLFCRDADSLPTRFELQAERVFLKSEYLIHSIKSHPHHHDELLAGLCGFKTRQLNKRDRDNEGPGYPLPASYEAWAKLGDDIGWRRWSDQYLLRDTFVHWRPWTLLSLTNGAPEPGPHPRIKGPRKVNPACYEKVDLSDVNAAMLSLCDELSPFPGAQLVPQDNHRERFVARWGHLGAMGISPGIVLQRALEIPSPETENLRGALSGLKEFFDKP